MERRKVTIDGNEAAAYVAHRTNEVIAIFPITPSSPMGEWADAWYAAKQKNPWGVAPLVRLRRLGRRLPRRNPEEAKRLLNQAQRDAAARWTFCKRLAAIQYSPTEPPA